MNSYHPTSKAQLTPFTGAAQAARRAKCKAWAAASVILFKPQAVTRHYGTRY